MTLNEIIKGYSYDLTQGDTDKEISNINNDSRAIKDKGLFIAEIGYTVDGHDYIDSAIKNGAVAIIIEKDVEVREDITLIKVEDVEDALAYISSRFYSKPWENLHLVGVTGTNGKTSVTYFLKSIFEAANKKTGLIGTMGSMIKDRKIGHANTTPKSISINRLLNEMVEEEIEYTFMEVSSHAIDLKRVEYMEFETGLFTNLSKDHLDYHGNMENYFYSKMELLKKASKNTIINMDDEYGKRAIDILRDKKKIITYGLTNEADVYATDIELGLSNVKFKLNIGEKEADICFSVPGKFSVYNALTAAACAYSYGINMEDIKLGLEKVEGVKGRFEVIPIDKDYTVIIDFAHTADGLEKVLEVIDEFVEGRKIVLFGAGGDRDRTKRPEMGRVVAKHADLSIVTSDNPRSEDPEGIIDDILVGTREITDDYIKIIDRIDGIHHAIDIAEKGDIILLAGKGHETYTLLGDKKIPCDERQIVMDYVENQ